LIVNEFLPLVVGADLVRELLATRPRFYCPEDEPFIPLEFADAASVTATRRSASSTSSSPTGRSTRCSGSDRFRPDRQAPRRLVAALRCSGPATGAALEADGRTAAALADRSPASDHRLRRRRRVRSLAARDLERGRGTGLPSGEAVAQLIGAEPLTDDELDLRRHGWRGETPLWLYILRESSARHDGDRLGEVGAA